MRFFTFLRHYFTLQEHDSPPPRPLGLKVESNVDNKRSVTELC